MPTPESFDFLSALFLSPSSLFILTRNRNGFIRKFDGFILFVNGINCSVFLING
ncbi:hypothetical protein PPNK14_03830 [Pectobacterium parmentieri]